MKRPEHEEDPNSLGRQRNGLFDQCGSSRRVDRYDRASYRAQLAIHFMFEKGEKLAIAFSVRDARQDEARWVMEMVRQMNVEMAQYGGRAATTDETAWDKIAGDIAEELKGDKSKFLIAETVGADRIGFAAASMSALGGAFASKKILHLRFVYVLPGFRGEGIGSKLVADALDWGRRTGGDCCDLNVLLGNPAMSLYKKLGFAEVAVTLTKPLENT